MPLLLVTMERIRIPRNPEVIAVSASSRLDHVESSIDSAQAILDRAQAVVTGLDAAHQRVERLAAVLRQAAIGLVVGGVVLTVLAVRHRAD
jgi:hypothetical protein